MQLRRALVVSAACALGLAACGAPGGQDPKAYVHNVCTAYATFEDELQTQGTTFTAAQTAAGTNAVKIKAAAVAFLSSQVAATATLQTAIAAQQRPAGNGGDAVRQGFLDASSQAHTIFAEQEQAVAHAPTTPVSFFQVLNTAQQQIEAADQDLQVGIENVAAKGDQKINDAISADDVCSSLG